MHLSFVWQIVKQALELNGAIGQIQNPFIKVNWSFAEVIPISITVKIMGSNILGIGQSALNAAQVGLSTTGHNIANAATPGYSRQVVIQGAAIPQNMGFGFVGQGTEIADVKRMYSSFLGTQVLSAQTSKSQLDAYSTQIQQIDNLLADPSAGLSPALQDFFKGVQDLAANPSDAASRQATLSSAEALASRFQGLEGRLDELRQGVNEQVTSSVGIINNYVQQIAQLNDTIEKAQSSTDGKAANDLLDQRDQLVADLSKEIKVTVVPQDGKYSIFMGNGQPLVVGVQTFALKAATSLTDPSRTEVAYDANGKTVLIGEANLQGGTLGGVLDFRNKTLDVAQNSLGRVAIGIATTFNAQHRLGQDLNGQLGGDFFAPATITPVASSDNKGNAVLAASISNVSALTTSDYRVQVVAAGSYQVTRLSDGAVTSFASFPQTIDGFDLSLASGTAVAGDEFLVRPTADGASEFKVAITDTSKIAAAAPIVTAAATTNTGSGKISAGSVNAPPPPDPNLQQPVTITFTSATTFDVTGTGTGNPTGVTYSGGGNISYNGWTFQISGAPLTGDTFTIGPNSNGVGDSRNALLLGSLQNTNTLANGTTTYQGAYAQLVSLVGNKSHELKVTSSAADSLLTQAVQAQQAESGVNLDEEATNLLRYQQAYQAAGKVMQIASQLFDTLLSLGQ
jgi:flagellar hook-associated protein 1